jgi:hypothetical protein
MGFLSFTGTLAYSGEPSSERVVTAKEFRLIDEKGNERAILGTRGGSSGLFLMGQDQTIRLHLFLLPDNSPAILLTDERGTVRVKVNQVEESSILALSDRNGKMRLLLTVSGEGKVSLVTLDAEGHIQSQTGLDDRATGPPTTIPLDLHRR